MGGIPTHTVTEPRCRLQVERISKSYPGRAEAVRALSDVSLSLDGGELLALLGPNGAGKTSLIKVIAGLLLADSGTVLARDMTPGAGGRRPVVACLLEGTRQLYWRLTAWENIEYFSVLRGAAKRTARARADAFLGRFGLEDKRRALVSTLSRGMQQKLALICCLMSEPDILILDEPTLGLDLEGCDLMLETIAQIKRDGIGILLATHQLEIADKVADKVAILDRGRLIRSGTRRELLGAARDPHFVVRLARALDAALLERVQARGASPKGETELRVPLDARTLAAVVAELDSADIAGVTPYELSLEDLLRQSLRERTHA